MLEKMIIKACDWIWQSWVDVRATYRLFSGVTWRQPAEHAKCGVVVAEQH